MDLLTLKDDGRTRLLISREYMLAANRLAKPPPWHSGGRRWALSASTVAMAEREARLVPTHPASCPPSFWSLQRSSPAKPGMRRARTAHSASYAERTRFNPEPYRAEPCHECNSLRQCLNNEFLKNFDSDQLKHVQTSTRNTLPTQKTIQDERRSIVGDRSRQSETRWLVKRASHVRHFTSSHDAASRKGAAGSQQNGGREEKADADSPAFETLQNIEGEDT